MELTAGQKFTEIGPVPCDWDVCKLGELGKFKNGLNKAGDAFGHGSPIVNLLDVFGVSRIVSSADLGLVAAASSERQMYDLRRGDVLFVRSSVKPSGVGLTAVIENNLSDTVFSGFLIRFRDRGALHLDFKRYCFYESGFRTRLVGASSVSANTNISQSYLKTALIALPPTRREQKAIGEALSDADALIESLEQLLARKRQIKQGAMQELLTGRRRMAGVEVGLRRRMTDIGEIPEDWTVVPFNRAVRLFLDFRGRTPRKLGLTWGGGDIRALSADNVQMGRIDSAKDAYFGGDELYKKWMTQGDCDRGDVLLTTEAPLGNVAQIPDSQRYILSQRVVLVKAEQSVDSAYLMHYMMGPLFQAQLRRKASGTTAKGIQRKILEQLPIALPTMRSEQTQIAEVLTDMNDEITQIELRIVKARAMKQAMMQNLLTGRIRLVDAKTPDDLQLVQST